MKLYFCRKTYFTELLIVTTAVASALSLPVAALAKTTQQFAQITIHVLVQPNYPVNCTDIFKCLRQGNASERKSDNPAPIPGSPGGSR